MTKLLYLPVLALAGCALFTSPISASPTASDKADGNVPSAGTADDAQSRKAPQAAGPWTTDFEAALAKAKETKKDVVAVFSGSDWCGACIAMDKEVFSKKEFTDKAAGKFILLLVDLPKNNPEVEAKNRPHADKFKIFGYPTLVMLDADGNEFDRFFPTRFPAVDALLARLNEGVEKRGME